MRVAALLAYSPRGRRAFVVVVSVMSVIALTVPRAPVDYGDPGTLRIPFYNEIRVVASFFCLKPSAHSELLLRSPIRGDPQGYRT